MTARYAGHAARGPGAGAREIAAIPLLLIGGVVLPFVGWVIGVALLWSSPRWSRRDKWIGTFLLPGGLLPFGIIAVQNAGVDCPSRPRELEVPTADGSRPGEAICQASAGLQQTGQAALVVAALVIPVVTALFLSIRLATRERNGNHARVA